MTKATLTSDSTADDVPDVADILERLRLADVRLARRRQQETGLPATDRAAMRYVLERMDVEEVTPTMIARAMHLSPAAGTALIDRLIHQGLITVRPHPRDRRKKLVHPIDRSVDPDHVDPLTTRLRALAGELPDAEARAIAQFLQKVLAAVTATPLAHQ